MNSNQTNNAVVKNNKNNHPFTKHHREILRLSKTNPYQDVEHNFKTKPDSSLKKPGRNHVTIRVIWYMKLIKGARTNVRMQN